MTRKIVEGLFSAFTVVAASGLSIGFFIGGVLGWAYWMWMAFQLGSIGMFFFGILGPLSIVAAMLGLWSFLFGIPFWLVSIVG